MNKIKQLLSITFIGISSFCFSNNITISNVTLNGQNTVSDFTLINFDVAWNNSWHTNVGPSNWDAAWIFAKYRLKTSTVWNHCTLNWVNGLGPGDGHTVPAGSTINSANDNGAGGARGVFIYTTAVIAQGNVNYTGAKLRWNYGVDGLADADSVELCVYGIEMVYIPSSSYYLGDGDLTAGGQFRTQAANTPFQITSEASITLGGSVATSLLVNTPGQNTPDDFNTITTQTLPASWPKAFSAYYMMKYEISQEQYMEFLNKLTRTQQATRNPVTTVGNYFANANGFAVPQSRNGIKLMSDPGGLTARVYGCDLNNNGTAGESGDGQTLACDWLSSCDVEAYADWSGLRPMTEFEFEKACRGTLTPVASEYAWGSTSILGAAGITNSGATNEISSTAGSNCVYNNAVGVPGPMRVGNFAQAATNRQSSGGSYYGIMDLTGNVWEDVVTCGSTAGRSYTAVNGNGALNANGQADVNFWPGINGNNNPATANTAYLGVTGCTNYAGYTFTGGTWNAATWLIVSNRDYRGAGWNGISGRDVRNGGRLVRIAP